MICDYLFQKGFVLYLKRKEKKMLITRSHFLVLKIIIIIIRVKYVFSP
jgi:hypothetical protein